MWDENIRYVHAENVTDRYVDLYKAYESTIKADGRHIPVKVMMFRTEQCMQNSDDRMAANVDVFCGREQMGGGRTAGSTQDMKNKTYTFKYTDEKGREKLADVKVKEEPLTVKLYMQ